MVKFAKQLEGSLVPEWKDAYCNYKELKRDVKRIKQERLQQSASAPARHHGSMGSFSQFHNLGNHLRRTAYGLNPLTHTGEEVLIQGSHATCTLPPSSSIHTERNLNFDSLRSTTLIRCLFVDR